ncbi:YeiH family protein [Capnocytophaga sp.]|uniref:YeiH family protein n=1 Tax=Capnocytophaga sp. TaxID=44737 RepID=UPI0026DAB525|nr:YeiH family protein [Capnocytophaga sp.]MDO5105478.1 YeiH family protein [Capnocytophaga sp.]
MFNDKKKTKHFFFGVLIVLLVTILGFYLDKTHIFKSFGFSGLTLAIVIGILLGNTFYPKIAPFCNEGVVFSKSKLLKLGIVLYGFRLTFQEVVSIGFKGILIDFLMLSTTFLLAYWLGNRVLKIDKHIAVLIGSGCSICGAAAVMATEPIVRARSEKTTIAIAVVVIFGTIGIFLYPAMYQWDFWGLSDASWGVYMGATIHEVGQVVAAGDIVGSAVAPIAVTTKMIRVMMLAPFLIFLSALMQKNESVAGQQSQKITIPWFAVGFILVVCINSLQLIPQKWVDLFLTLDTLLLTMAMAALGLTTHIRAVKQAGVKPFVLGVLLMLWLVIMGGVFTKLFEDI